MYAATTKEEAQGRIWSFSEVAYFHDPFRMCFRAERMIPAISSR